MRNPKVRKHIYLVSYYNEEGEEDIIEVPAYSAAQAELMVGNVGSIIGIEETVRRDYRMEEADMELSF